MSNTADIFDVRSYTPDENGTNFDDAELFVGLAAAGMRTALSFVRRWSRVSSNEIQRFLLAE